MPRIGLKYLESVIVWTLTIEQINYLSYICLILEFLTYWQYSSMSEIRYMYFSIPAANDIERTVKLLSYTEFFIKQIFSLFISYTLCNSKACILTMTRPKEHERTYGRVSAHNFYRKKKIIRLTPIN